MSEISAMENVDNENKSIPSPWKLIPANDFLSTLGVGQYVLSQRASPNVVAVKADEELYEMSAKLNRWIDKLLHQPGGGDHPALDWVWKRLERKLVQEFDLYMQVVDKSQLLQFPKNISVLDVTPAFGLMYSKIVKVPINAGILENPAPQVVTNRVGELEANVEMDVEEGDIDQRLEQEGNVNQQRGEGVSQLEIERRGVPGFDQDQVADRQSKPKVSVDPGLEQVGGDFQPEPEVNAGPGLGKDVEAGSSPEPDVNVGSELEKDGEADPQPEPQVNEFPSLITEVMAGGIDESAGSNGMQAMEMEENTPMQTPNAPDIVGLVACNIRMPRLEDIIEPEAMAAYWRMYNKSTKLMAAVDNPNQTLKPILKSTPSQRVQKKNVRFQVNVTKEKPKCQNNVQAMKKRRQKKKHMLVPGGIRTRSAQKKRNENNKLCFNGIMLRPDLIDQGRSLRSRTF